MTSLRHDGRPERTPRTAAGAPIPASAGIGLRFPHHQRVIAEQPDVAWLEVHPENYLQGGPPADDLLEIRQTYPVSLHATGLSLGSADGVDAAHLAAIADLARQVEPGLISDHLSWSAVGGVFLPDLLPVPMTGEALEVFDRNVDRAQSVLGRAILVENPSTYVRFARDEMDEGVFLAELVRRSGCGVLLDINNLFVSAMNLGEAPIARLTALLDAVPAQSIGEIHLAGHAQRVLPGGQVLRIDDHGSPVNAGVWALFQAAVDRIGPRPTLIEWDTDIPSLETLMGEARSAERSLARQTESLPA